MISNGALPVMEAAVVYRGKPVLLKRADNETGYLNVLKQTDGKRRKPYYAKFDRGDGSKQKFLNGSSSETAEEAAMKLAYFLAGHDGELPPVDHHLGRRPSEVSARPLWLPSNCPACCCRLTLGCLCAGSAGRKAGEAPAPRREACSESKAEVAVGAAVDTSVGAPKNWEQSAHCIGLAARQPTSPACISACADAPCHRAVKFPPPILWCF